MVNSFDELKAEAVGVKLFLQMLKQKADSGRGENRGVGAEQYCLALLGTLFDYLQKSSSGSQRRYYYTGQILMHSCSKVEAWFGRAENLKLLMHN